MESIERKVVVPPNLHRLRQTRLIRPSHFLLLLFFDFPFSLCPLYAYVRYFVYMSSSLIRRKVNERTAHLRFTITRDEFVGRCVIDSFVQRFTKCPCKFSEEMRTRARSLVRLSNEQRQSHRNLFFFVLISTRFHSFRSPVATKRQGETQRHAPKKGRAREKRTRYSLSSYYAHDWFIHHTSQSDEENEKTN